MKKLVYLIVPAFILAMASFSGCEKKNIPENNVNTNIGYIMDYVQCNGIVNDGDSATAIGYNIITENLRDTFETYTLPNNINKFPLDFFQNIENYRYSYKIEFEYEDEDMPIVCPDLYLVKYPYSKKIKIISVTLIN